MPTTLELQLNDWWFNYKNCGFVCCCSVGKAKVPEGSGAMAARHRGESSWTGRGRSSLVIVYAPLTWLLYFPGGVRGLERQRGQQEDLRGSEETRPVVDSPRGNNLKSVLYFLFPICFYLFVVMLFYRLCPTFHPICWLCNVATVELYNKLNT